MQHHVLVHKNMHNAMYGMGENGHHHKETDAETMPKHQTEASPQPDMWQLRIFHTPQRTKQIGYTARLE